MSPIQLALSRKAACELAAKVANVSTKASSAHGILALDLKNAYNSLLRSKVIPAVRDMAPEILHFVHLFYNSPSTYRITTQSGCSYKITAPDGVEQGDSLSSVIFALTIHESLKAVQEEAIEASKTSNRPPLQF